MEGVTWKHGTEDVEIKLTRGAMVDKVGSFFATAVAPAGAGVSILFGDELQDVLVAWVLNEARGAGTMGMHVKVTLVAMVDCGESRVPTDITCVRLVAG